MSESSPHVMSQPWQQQTRFSMGHSSLFKEDSTFFVINSLDEVHALPRHHAR
jgi:hypothetical protein